MDLLGDMISELRRDRNLNQRDLAKLLHVSIATISHYESEINSPDIATLSKLADFFGVTIDYLVGRTRLRIDFDTLRRKVRMLDGGSISADEVLDRFLKLSDRSQTDIINLMQIYQIRDNLYHNEVISPAGEALEELRKKA